MMLKAMCRCKSSERWRNPTPTSSPSSRPWSVAASLTTCDKRTLLEENMVLCMHAILIIWCNKCGKHWKRKTILRLRISKISVIMSINIVFANTHQYMYFHLNLWDHPLKKAYQKPRLSDLDFPAMHCTAHLLSCSISTATPKLNSEPNIKLGYKKITATLVWRYWVQKIVSPLSLTSTPNFNNSLSKYVPTSLSIWVNQ